MYKAIFESKNSGKMVIKFAANDEADARNQAEKWAFGTAEEFGDQIKVVSVRMDAESIIAKLGF